jgi:hypothetical protein
MATTKTMIEQAYTACNKRDIDGALALMTQVLLFPSRGKGLLELPPEI